MASFLKKLKDNEALLMLYVSGEMSPLDRQEVDRRLEADESLRAQLAELQVAHAVYLQAMKSLSGATAPPVPAEVAALRASRATRQWVSRRLAHPIPINKSRLLLPRWSYPVAAAAAMLVAVTYWSVDHHFRWWEDHQKSYTFEAALDDPTLTAVEQDNLLNEIGRSETAGPTSPLDEADQTIASLQNPDDKDSLFLGLGSASDNREGTR
jgi:hypothetical protein